VRRALLAAGLALALGLPLGLVVQKERVLRSGRTVLLALAPVDPRSLMQGDYMSLAYDVARSLPPAAAPDGRIVLADDGRGVARLVRVDAGEPLAAGEYLLRYRIRGGSVRLGAESLFFQEGTGDALAGARFGELRVDGQGGAVLVGLRDADLRPLGRRP
jgi:uncharacterized membrane-anchored protein